jgi:hypothetical protein
MTAGDQAQVRRVAHIGAWSGWLSAIVWIGLGADSIARPMQDTRRDVFWWIPFALLVLLIIGVHSAQRARQLRSERYSFLAVMLAAGLVFLGNLGIVFDLRALSKLGFPGGAIIWTAGLIAYGAVTWRARVLPWYAALGLILWEPGSIVTGLLLSPIAPLLDRGAYSAGLEKGLATALIAFGLQATFGVKSGKRELVGTPAE